ncbi:MAG TPA: hypothetical protein VHG08_09835 [Longimicrobium sp.]|nr:hypothetical protein [Longimicrobium sp.]
MTDTTAHAPVRGDQLSCYTAAIAAYMLRHGIDPDLALGTQLFLAAQKDAGPLLRFVHYHTPLLGERPTHRLHLARQWAADEREAGERIAAEVRRHGAAIVVGDGMNLPWLVTHGRRHAPHWFLVHGIDDAAGTAAASDAFEFMDEAGEQGAWSGEILLDRLGAAARVNPVEMEVYRAREHLAFGMEERTPHPVFSGHQWFEALEPPRARTLAADDAWALLAATWRFHGGAAAPAHLEGRWTTGLAALAEVAATARAHLADTALYDVRDDLWVAGRVREAFARVLHRLAGELDHGGLGELAAWCDAELVPQWQAVPRLMRYNLGCLERGRRASALLADTLDRIVALEAEAMERLGVLAGAMAGEAVGAD